jgi:hypothetical protein
MVVMVHPFELDQSDNIGPAASGLNPFRAETLFGKIEQ